MNNIYQSIWNAKSGTYVAASEHAKAGGKKNAGARKISVSRAVGFALKSLAASVMLAAGFNAYALPTGDSVAAGAASIESAAGNMTINQTSQNVSINWQGFSIGQGEAVKFVQPNSSAVALNRVLGSDPSSILGSLDANGKVFLINPNGVLFGQSAAVNVGGMVASTLNISDSDFMAGDYVFSGTGDGSVVNQGEINADGGYVALLGANVSNQGVIQANLGTVALAAGDAITLDVAGDGLLNVAVDQGSVEALVQNGGLIQANGGKVLMTARSAGDLFQSSVNNTGVVRAQSIENRNGTITLLGDMHNGTVKVGGTLDASAANGGDGGFIETSAAHVKIANDVQITTAAPLGKTGTWLIDPVDFIISSDGDIAGSTLSTQLVTSNVRIENVPGAGNGDIFVNEAVTWTPTPNPTTLTLNAARDVIVNEDITTTGGNLQLFAERDVVLNKAITTTTSGGGGDLTAVAGRNIEVNALAALTTTGGDIVLLAANDGTGAGTVSFAADTPPVAVTGPLSSVNIFYAPVSYATPTDFSGNFTLTGEATLTSHMWVFPKGVDKMYDGYANATLELMGNPTLAGDVNLQPGEAVFFDSPNVGTDKTVTYSGYSLGGGDAGLFALFAPFNTVTGQQGVPGAGVTTANITQAPLTITANDATKVFGETLILENSAFTSVGLVAGETIGGVTLTSDGTVATATVDDSPYAITPSEAVPGTFDPNNYDINYIDGQLLITQAVPPVDPIDPVEPPVDPIDPPLDPVDPILTTEAIPREVIAGVINQPVGSPPAPPGPGVNHVTEAPGINLQVTQMTELPADPVVIVEEQPKPIYVPPVFAPRQDRN